MASCAVRGRGRPRAAARLARADRGAADRAGDRPALRDARLRRRGCSHPCSCRGSSPQLAPFRAHAHAFTSWIEGYHCAWLRVRSECSADRRAGRSRQGIACPWSVGDRGTRSQPSYAHLPGADLRSVGFSGDVVRRLPNPRGRSGAGVGAAVRVVATECTPANAVSPSRGRDSEECGGATPSARRRSLPRSCWASAPPQISLGSSSTSLSRAHARTRENRGELEGTPPPRAVFARAGVCRRAHPTRPPTRRVGARRVGRPYPHPRRDRRVPGAWSRGSALAA